MDLEDTGCRARFLIRDRDGKFPELFDAVLADAGIAVVLSGVRMPRMNAIMERWVQTCRRELLDRTLIWNQRHLLHALREFEELSGSGNALLRSRPLRTVRARRPSTRLKQPTRALRSFGVYWSGSCAASPWWRRAQWACTRRVVVRMLPSGVMAWWVIALRRPAYQVCHCWEESGGRSVYSSSSPHSGQRPFWRRRRRSVNGPSCGGWRRRRRPAQYWARAGSSGEFLPVTGTCRTIFVQV